MIDAIEDALGLPERDPFAGHALRGRLRGLHSMRLGVYRILYQVTEDRKTVAWRRSVTARSPMARTPLR